MSLLAELNTLLEPTGLPVETGVFSDAAPDSYLVLTPLSDSFEMFADNKPHFETQEIRLSLFSKGSYIRHRNSIVRALLDGDYTITDRRYIGWDDTSGYHQYAIDIQKDYELKEDE